MVATEAVGSLQLTRATVPVKCPLLAPTKKGCCIRFLSMCCAAAQRCGQGTAAKGACQCRHGVASSAQRIRHRDWPDEA